MPNPTYTMEDVRALLRSANQARRELKMTEMTMLEVLEPKGIQFIVLEDQQGIRRMHKGSFNRREAGIFLHGAINALLEIQLTEAGAISESPEDLEPSR